jgi:hypothetical protein
MGRVIPKVDFSGSKALIHLAVTRAVLHPDEDEILDMVFTNPKEALSKLEENGKINLSAEEESELITFGKKGFVESFTKLGMSEIVQRLVDTESRLDMPETA